MLSKSFGFVFLFLESLQLRNPIENLDPCLGDGDYEQVDSILDCGSRLLNVAFQRVKVPVPWCFAGVHIVLEEMDEECIC